MRNPYKPLLCFAMLIFILAGCAQTAPTPTQERKRVLRSDISSFASLEEMHEAIQEAKRSPQKPIAGVLEYVDYYYIPENLPEGYNLYRVDVTDFSLNCTYIKAENPQNMGREELRELRKTQEDLRFTSQRYIREDQMGYALRARAKSEKDLIDGKYFYEDIPQTLCWEEYGYLQRFSIDHIYVNGEAKPVFTKEELLSYGHVKRVDVPNE